MILPDQKTPSLVFALADVHEGPRVDLPSLFSHLRQEIILMGPKGGSPYYPHVLTKKGVSVFLALSETLRTHLTHSDRYTDSDISENRQFYQSIEVVQNIDTFVCTFPASMCQLWLAMNKSVVFLPAHRYNLGRCSPNEWGKLNDDLYNMAADQSGKYTIATMSNYDAEYLKYYTGIKPIILTSFSGYYVNGYPYNATKEEFLIVVCDWAPEQGNTSFSKGVMEILQPEMKAVKFHDFYQRFTLSDLVSHRAIIMLPYSVMSYKLTEFYALGIPLFVPSLKFYRDIGGLGADRPSVSHWYCNNPNLEKEMRPTLESGFSSHIYSPNIEQVIIIINGGV